MAEGGFEVQEMDISDLEGQNFLNCEEKVKIVKVPDTFAHFISPFRAIVAGQ